MKTFKEYLKSLDACQPADNRNFILWLKTLPENSGQLVDYKHCDGIIRCRFMWFYTHNKIDLLPINNINIITIDSRHFDKILPVF
jgi:hypothetical protein